MNLKQTLIAVGIGALVILGIVSIAPKSYGVKVNTDRQTFLNGFDVDASAAASTIGGALTVGTTFSVGSLATLDGGQLRSNTNSTSTTATTQTLAVADVSGYDTILLTPNVGALTLSFFASSTASTWLPAAGDMQETCFQNATSTTAATIIFAAGTGIDLETASSSPTDLTLLAGNTACFKFIRQKASASAFDITAAMTEYTNGD